MYILKINLVKCDEQHYLTTNYNKLTVKSLEFPV